MTAVRWADRTREELRSLLPEAVVVLPIGATEQHGPHLVTAMDTLAAEAVAAAGAARATRPERVVLAPTLPFGASHHHLPFGGTLSLTAATLAHVLADLLESAAASGARRLLLLNGHGGNSATCAQAAADAARLHGIVVAAADYWALAPVDGAWGEHFPGHAGAFETSLMGALRPDGVREQALRPSPGTLPAAVDGLRLETPRLWAQIDGFTDDPRRADAAAGAAAFDRLADAVARAIDAVAEAPA
ncbi:creatininase family protein [Conexibacter woesei]|uniref:Creatininase n=1 Tax=Conexibacter woesei (strain DSM 14684 / CCUG 47730 / CIP 108061 / JCM 11494 / NBRC 100937 / ID131577) TaxID=469383 RepID=D3FDC5_CONWI|nr:creatininase family protein [Conexibacter woesei]ADB53517.1 Creatininase [Conexibacter woesei DSM 14684]